MPDAGPPARPRGGPTGERTEHTGGTGAPPSILGVIHVGYAPVAGSFPVDDVAAEAAGGIREPVLSELWKTEHR